MTDDSRIQIYQSPDGETQVDVRFEHETVWLTQAQMGGTVPHLGHSAVTGLFNSGLYPQPEAEMVMAQQNTVEGDLDLLKKTGELSVNNLVLLRNRVRHRWNEKMNQ